MIKVQIHTKDIEPCVPLTSIGDKDKLTPGLPKDIPEMNSFGMGWRTLADGHERVVAITQWPNALSLRLHQWSSSENVYSWTLASRHYYYIGQGLHQFIPGPSTPKISLLQSPEALPSKCIQTKSFNSMLQIFALISISHRLFFLPLLMRLKSMPGLLVYRHRGTLCCAPCAHGVALL